MNNIKRYLPVALSLLFISTIKAQSYEQPITNPFGLSPTGMVSDFHFSSFTDLDDDGDQDLLISDFDGVFHYFENTGDASNPIYDGGVTNPMGISVVDYPNCACNTMPPRFVDIDGDGDQDIIAISWYGATYYFAENTGTASSPSFSDFQDTLSWMPASFTYGPYPGIDFVDIDADGDFDLFTCEQDKLSFRENEGTATSPQFSSTLVTDAFGVMISGTYLFPSFADIDGDGDYDLFVGGNSSSLDDFQFFENTGTPTNPVFAAAIENPFGLSNTNVAIPSIAFVDLDGDSDLDIFTGGKVNSNIEFKYYENSATVSSVSEENNMQKLFSVYPNPTSNWVMIQLPEMKDELTIEITNTLGAVVLVKKTKGVNNHLLDLSSIVAGNYIITVKSSEINQTTPLIIEK